MNSPQLYGTFLFWLLSELFEDLPEIGDPDKPMLVFFFDEAHLLFNDAPKALLERIDHVVRLIRSKGVGVYFVTQNPARHAGRRLSASSATGCSTPFAPIRRVTPKPSRPRRIPSGRIRLRHLRSHHQFGVGEALVSTLEVKGVPSVVERTLIRPPSSRIGTISEDERRKIIATSPIGTIYDNPVDRESAFEVLSVRVETKTTTVVEDEPEAGNAEPEPEESGTSIGGMIGSILGTSRPRGKRLSTTQRVARSVTRTITTRVVGGAAAEIGKKYGGSIGGSIGRAIVRGVLGGILRS